MKRKESLKMTAGRTPGETLQGTGEFLGGHVRFVRVPFL